LLYGCEALKMQGDLAAEGMTAAGRSGLSFESSIPIRLHLVGGRPPARRLQAVGLWQGHSAVRRAAPATAKIDVRGLVTDKAEAEAA
jgi:hypothetical protein